MDASKENNGLPIAERNGVKESDASRRRLTRKAVLERLRREGKIAPLPYLLLLRKLGVEW